LPAGLTLNANGLISGTPTQTGTFSFTAQALHGATGQTASRQFSIVVNRGRVQDDDDQGVNIQGNIPYNARVKIEEISSEQFNQNNGGSFSGGSGSRFLQISLEDGGTLIDPSGFTVTLRLNNAQASQDNTFLFAFTQAGAMQQIEDFQIANGYITFTALEIGNYAILHLDAPPTNPPNLGLIIGASVGGTLGAVAIAVVIILIMKKKKA
jgi:hypothetical protein